MEFTFENLLATNLINFIIVIAVLALIVKKARLADVIQKLADDVKNDIEKSSLSAANALSEYKTTKKATKDTPKLQEEIISNAKSNAQNLKEKIEQKTKMQQEEIKCSIEKIYQNQSEKTKKMTLVEIYGACVDLAQDEVVKKLDENTHKKLINSSINELENIEGSIS